MLPKFQSPFLINEVPIKIFKLCSILFFPGQGLQVRISRRGEQGQDREGGEEGYGRSGGGKKGLRKADKVHEPAGQEGTAVILRIVKTKDLCSPTVHSSYTCRLPYYRD